MIFLKKRKKEKQCLTRDLIRDRQGENKTNLATTPRLVRDHQGKNKTNLPHCYHRPYAFNVLNKHK